MSTVIAMLPLFFALQLGVVPVRAQTAAQLEKRLATNPDNIKARVKLAELRLQEERFKDAVDLLNAYTDQLTPAGFRALAFAYSSLNDYANEVRVLNIIAGKEEENHEWHMLLAQAYLKQASVTSTDLEKHKSLLTSGIQKLRYVLRLQPKYKPAYDLLLKTLIQQREHNEAREVLIEGITKFGKRPDLLRELCRLDANDGFLPQAIANCSESIKVSPNYADHYVYLVQALHDQKEDVRAEKEIVKAGRKFPKSEFVQWAAGTMYLKRKNYPVATRYFQAAVKADPNSTRSAYGLAQALFESGQEVNALEYFIKTCKSETNSIETFLAAGGRLKMKGDTQLANKYISAANTCK